MNFIVSWIMRLCELRDAIARGQVAGAMLIPNFLSSLRARLNDPSDENDTTRAEYALVVLLLALVVIAGYRTMIYAGLTMPM